MTSFIGVLVMFLLTSVAGAQEFVSVLGKPLPRAIEREAAVRAVGAVLDSGTKFYFINSQLCRQDLLDDQCPPLSAYSPGVSDLLPTMPPHDSTTFHRIVGLYGTDSKTVSWVRFQRPLLRGDTIVVAVAIIAKLATEGEYDETTYEVLLSNDPQPRVFSKTIAVVSSARSVRPLR